MGKLKMIMSKTFTKKMDERADENLSEVTPKNKPFFELIQTLKAELEEEREEKETLKLERAKLKVCWEMTLEELSATRTELTERINKLECELQSQYERKKVLQELLEEYGKDMNEMRSILEAILVGKPKSTFKC